MTPCSNPCATGATAHRVPLLACPAVVPVRTSHCWASQQWHPISTLCHHTRYSAISLATCGSCRFGPDRGTRGQNPIPFGTSFASQNNLQTRHLGHGICAMHLTVLFHCQDGSYGHGGPEYQPQRTPAATLAKRTAAASRTAEVPRSVPRLRSQWRLRRTGLQQSH